MLIQGCGVLVAALVAPIAAAQTFDAASVRAADPQSQGFSVARLPARVDYHNWDLKHLLIEAYDLRDDQIVGPRWLNAANPFSGSGRYVVSAIYPAGTSRPQFRLMLQALLTERFQLKLRREQRETAVYDLVVDRGGPKLRNVDPQGIDGVAHAGPGHIDGTQVTMKTLVGLLSRRVDRPVIDRTGIQGTADFTLDWIPDELKDVVGDDVFSALRAQLGLRLVPRKAPREFLIVDHAEQVPIENL